jgi:tetratricopeptide (TPR) repeat protein
MKLAQLSRRTGASVVALLVSAAATPAQSTLDEDRPWSALTAEGVSLVFGRFEGQFDGPLFRSRRIRLQQEGSEKNYFIPVGDGLGYFETLLPPGVYAVTGLEANYVALTRPLNIRNYRPVRQKFGVLGESGAPPPSFFVRADRPVYLGTLQADTGSDGIVYQGHQLRVLDEYQAAYERLAQLYPRLTSSLKSAGAVPSRHFILKPTPAENPSVEPIDVDDPVRMARIYIAEGKFQAAVNWLTTFMPSSEAERLEARLLVGEALLADQKLEPAIEKLGEVLQEKPDNLRALRLLARAHAQSGNYEDAASLFEALKRARPEDVEANLQLGYSFALRSEPTRAAEAFSSAFKRDQDYLLHDALPFALALRAVKAKGGLYEPPRMVRQDVPPPRNLQSRRGAAESGGLSLIIDQNGKVAAARLGSDTAGPVPVLLMSVMRAVFRPAEVNGVPVPSVLVFGGEAGAAAQ